MEDDTQPTSAVAHMDARVHTHAHYHRTMMPDGRRSAVYWHTHEHGHAFPVHASGVDERHLEQSHDHAHGKQASDALTVIRVAA